MLPLRILPVMAGGASSSTIWTLRLPLRARMLALGLMSALRWRAEPALRRGDLMLAWADAPMVRLLRRRRRRAGPVLAVLEARERGEKSKVCAGPGEGVGDGQSYGAVRCPVGVSSRSVSGTDAEKPVGDAGRDCGDAAWRWGVARRPEAKIEEYARCAVVAIARGFLIFLCRRPEQKGVQIRCGNTERGRRRE